MSVRFEWMDPDNTHAEIVATGTELGECTVDAPYALVLSIDEAVVFEGTRTSLLELAARITRLVAALPPSEDEPADWFDPLLRRAHVVDGTGFPDDARFLSVRVSI